MTHDTENTSRTPYIDKMELIVHHTKLPHTVLSDKLDAFIRRIGELVSWVWLPLVLVIVGNVVMRYIFDQGRVEFEEIQWHLYSLGFLIGLSYCYQADDHVRVDVLHDRMSLKWQTWIEFIGIVFFLLPFIAIILIYSVPFVYDSFMISEVSDAPGGLPFRWAIKSVLFFSFVLLCMAALSRLLRCTAFLFGLPKPVKAADSEEA